MTWVQFTGVFVAFFVTHTVPVRPPVRPALVGLLGERGFTAAYSVLSLAMLAAVIAAAGHAPTLMVWPQMPWQRHVVFGGMFAVCLILAFSLGRPNPFSFGGARNDRFDPQRPGIVRWMRHPVLVALALWASLHLLPNGDLAHVLLFGIFALFAVLGRGLIDRRKKREMTPTLWQALHDRVAAQPPMGAPASTRGAVVRILLAVVAYGALLVFHDLVIGVPLVAL